MIRLSVIKRCLICLFIGYLVFMGGGCRFPWTPVPVEHEALSSPQPQLLKMYHQAVTAYQAAQYGVAAKRFAAVQAKAVDSDMANSASFGLACTRLMAAETPRQYHEAVALWDAWVETAPGGFEKANPVLMVPLVKEKMLFSNIPLTPDGRGDVAASPKVSQWLVINAAKEIARLKSKLDSDDQSTAKLKGRIAILEKEMAKLRKQIKALETIDQKIQKKKHATP